MRTVHLQTIDGQHYLCAEPGGRVVADRTSAGSWEQWQIEAQGDGLVSLRSAHERYLCAEADGSVVSNREAVGAWETWRLVRNGDGLAFCSAHGRYLVAEGGGGGVVRADREAAGAWETFTPSESLFAAPDAPVGHPDPFRGQLRIEGGAYVDDSGPRLPVFLHLGDLIGQGLAFGVEHILPALDFAAAHGYHGVRSWFQLFTQPGGWWDRKPAPRWDPRADPQRFAEILVAGAARGLTWHLAGGGIKDVSNRDEDSLFDCLADAIGAVGPEHIALVEACNEIRDTGDSDDRDPAELARLVQRVRARFPGILYALSAFTGHEDRDVLRAWTPEWMAFYLVHGERGGRLHDKLRHEFSLGYSGEAPTVRRLGWQGEPWGVGRLVSAQGGHGEIDAQAMQLGAAMAAMSRQAWTVMSGPGVIFGDEPLEAMPGLAEVPALVRQLPQDLMRFSVLGHAGPSRRGTRVHAARDDWRADYAIDTGTSRYVEIQYGPPEQRRPLDKERITWDDHVLLDGPWGRVTTGRLS